LTALCRDSLPRLQTIAGPNSFAAIEPIRLPYYGEYVIVPMQFSIPKNNMNTLIVRLCATELSEHLALMLQAFHAPSSAKLLTVCPSANFVANIYWKNKCAYVRRSTEVRYTSI
jgi:hypothetical protein